MCVLTCLATCAQESRNDCSTFRLSGVRYSRPAAPQLIARCRRLQSVSVVCSVSLSVTTTRFGKWRGRKNPHRTLTSPPFASLLTLPWSQVSSSNNLMPWSQISHFRLSMLWLLSGSAPIQSSLLMWPCKPTCFDKQKWAPCVDKWSSKLINKNSDMSATD